MKKKYEKLPLGILLASIAAALLSIIARSALTLTALDSVYGVYEHGTILPTLYHSVLAVAIIIFAIIALLKAPSREADYISEHSDFTTFASCVCAFLLAADILIELYNIVVNRTAASTLDILDLCFAIPAVLYFLGLVRSQEKRSVLLMFSSFFPIAWCAVCLIRIYFDTTVLQVSPNKIMGEVALLAAMVYFLSETRAQIGAINHKLYLATAAVTPILLTTSAIPNLLFPKLLSIGSSDSFMRYAIDTALAIFIWARLAAYAKMKCNEE